MKKNKKVLQVENVKKYFKLDGITVKAVDGISFDIKEGEFVSIMGPSGSGKSTLMHLIGCLDVPTDGKVIIDGQDVSKMQEKQLAKVRNKKIGFIFQSFNLLQKLNSIENVALPLLYGGFKEKEAFYLAKQELIKVGLEDRLFHYPNQLSGGQQQRVAIARATVTNPAIILGDEPTGNLDTKSSKMIMKILKDLHKKGKTIIIVTHSPEVAKQTQKTLKIRDGRLIK